MSKKKKWNIKIPDINSFALDKVLLEIEERRDETLLKEDEKNKKKKRKEGKL